MPNYSGKDEFMSDKYNGILEDYKVNTRCPDCGKIIPYKWLLGDKYYCLDHYQERHAAFIDSIRYDNND